MTRAKRRVRARVDRTGRHPPNSFQCVSAAQVASRAASATPAQIPMTFRSSILDHSSNPGIRLLGSSRLRDGFRRKLDTRNKGMACCLRIAAGVLGARRRGISPWGFGAREESRRPGSAGELRRDVRPILSDNCFACHGPDDHKRKAGLRLDTKEGAFIKLESGTTAIVPGRPDESELVDRIETNDADSRMPPKKSGKQLTAAQAVVLRRWVEQGAKTSTHWAFERRGNRPCRPSRTRAGRSARSTGSS